MAAAHHPESMYVADRGPSETVRVLLLRPRNKCLGIAMASMLENPTSRGAPQACGGVRTAGAARGGGRPQAAAAVVTCTASRFLSAAGDRSPAPAAACQVRSRSTEKEQLTTANSSFARCGIFTSRLMGSPRYTGWPEHRSRRLAHQKCDLNCSICPVDGAHVIRRTHKPEVVETIIVSSKATMLRVLQAARAGRQADA